MVNRGRPSRETSLRPEAKKDGCFRRLMLLSLLLGNVDDNDNHFGDDDDDDDDDDNDSDFCSAIMAPYNCILGRRLRKAYQVKLMTVSCKRVNRNKNNFFQSLFWGMI